MIHFTQRAGAAKPNSPRNLQRTTLWSLVWTGAVLFAATETGCAAPAKPATAPAAKPASPAPKPAAAPAASVPAPAANFVRAPANEFVVQDFIGRAWTNEALRYPAAAEAAKSAAAGQALVGPDGKAVPYQLVETDGEAAPSIEFMADVAPLEKRTYKFEARTETPATDLKVEDGANSIHVTNSQIGISIRKKLEPGQGPIEQLRLKSGAWAGDSRLDTKLAPTAYTAKVTAPGPVFTTVQCRTEFGDGSSWVLNFRLNANEPVIEVDETMALGDKASVFSLSLSDNFDPDKIFFRCGMQGKDGDIGWNATKSIIPGVVFVMEPWLQWANRSTEGAVFNTYSDADPDMLSLGAGFAGLWVDPAMPAEKRAAPRVAIVQDDAGLHADYVLKNGRRIWSIMTPDKEASLAVLKDQKWPYPTSLPHKYVIKHGQFPLDVVKDYVLDWSNEGESYPHLLLTKKQLTRIKAAAAKEPQPAERDISRVVNTRPISQWSMEEPIRIFLGTENELVGKFLAEQAEATMDEAVNTFLQQPNVPYGSAPHHQQILGTAPLVADAVLGSKYVSPTLRKRLLAQIAFCSYAMARPDYWSEERGYSANPNMTTSVYGYRVAMGSAISTHPRAHGWVNESLAGLKAQLYGWSDSNGGWLEAPHYAMVSYDAILGSALMASNAGLSDMVYDPQMKNVINWFGKWSTPNDSRFKGFRHLPPVGNTYISESTGEFSILASIWKEKDPQFASEMQWLYKQHKSWPYPGIGGGYPTIAGYRGLLADPTIPEKAPVWGSELFPKTGVLMRNKFPSDRETQMLLLAGGFGGWRSHWDDDSGSITMWGKGRIIADDYGYYGAAPSEDHSLPVAPEIQGKRLFDVDTFAAGKSFDYLRGARGPWQRQVAFVKNESPLDPNYFVFADTFKTAKPATWRMWFTASAITPGTASTLVQGKEDVDTDIFFVTPGDLGLKVEEKTRTSGSGNRPDGTQGATATTQLGLIATAPADGVMTYVIYPRLKTEKPPVVTSLADGKVVRVQTETGTDYVFLSAAPFTWSEGTISFSGKSGAVRFQGKRVVLELGEGGTVAARGQTLTSKQAARKEVGSK